LLSQKSIDLEKKNPFNNDTFIIAWLFRSRYSKIFEIGVAGSRAHPPGSNSAWYDQGRILHGIWVGAVPTTTI